MRKDAGGALLIPLCIMDAHFKFIDLGSPYRVKYYRSEDHETINSLSSIL